LHHRIAFNLQYKSKPATKISQAFSALLVQV